MNIYHDIRFSFSILLADIFRFRSRRKTADAMRLPLQLIDIYFTLYIVIVAKIKSIYLSIYLSISDVWAGSMYWLSSKWSEQIWYELYNCFAVFEPRSPGLVFMTHFLDLLKHNDVAAREEVV